MCIFVSTFSCSTIQLIIEFRYFWPVRFLSKYFLMMCIFVSTFSCSTIHKWFTEFRYFWPVRFLSTGGGGPPKDFEDQWNLDKGHSDKGHNRNNLRTKNKVQCTKWRLSLMARKQWVPKVSVIEKKINSMMLSKLSCLHVNI